MSTENRGLEIHVSAMFEKSKKKKVMGSLCYFLDVNLLEKGHMGQAARARLFNSFQRPTEYASLRQ